ncbi:MAG: hypothetical protein ACO1OB_09895 [Archangium sp.]
MLRVLLAVTVLSSAPVLAMCGDNGWSFWPGPKTDVPPNVQLVLDAYGESRTYLTLLADYGPALASATDRVPLKLAKKNIGESGVSQMILTPVRALKTGQTYRIAFKKRPPTWELEPDEGRWRVRGAADTTAPAWRSGPAVTARSFQRYGCGPGVHATLSVDVDESSAFLIEAHETKTGGIIEFLVPMAKAGEVTLGHGMCAGPFNFEEEDFTLQLFAVDAAGNRTPAPSGPLLIKKIDGT